MSVALANSKGTKMLTLKMMSIHDVDRRQTRVRRQRRHASAYFTSACWTSATTIKRHFLLCWNTAERQQINQSIWIPQNTMFSIQQTIKKTLSLLFYSPFICGWSIFPSITKFYPSVVWHCWSSNRKSTDLLQQC